MKALLWSQMNGITKWYNPSLSFAEEVSHSLLCAVVEFVFDCNVSRSLESKLDKKKSIYKTFSVNIQICTLSSEVNIK